VSLLLLGDLGLSDLGGDLGIVLTGVPDDGTETQESGDDGEDQGNDSLAGEGTGKRIGTEVGAAEVQTLIAGGVSAERNTQSLAVLVVGGVNLDDAGHDLGSLNDGRGKTGLQMPFDVAMEEPDTGVVGLETNGNVLL